MVLPARFCVSSLPLHFREEINFGQVRSFVAQKILFSRIRIGARGLIGVEFRACFLGILAGLNLRFTSDFFYFGLSLCQKSELFVCGSVRLIWRHHPSVREIRIS